MALEGLADDRKRAMVRDLTILCRISVYTDRTWVSNFEAKTRLFERACFRLYLQRRHNDLHYVHVWACASLRSSIGIGDRRKERQSANRRNACGFHNFAGARRGSMVARKRGFRSERAITTLKHESARCLRINSPCEGRASSRYNPGWSHLEGD